MKHVAVAPWTWQLGLPLSNQAYPISTQVGPFYTHILSVLLPRMVVPPHSLRSSLTVLMLLNTPGASPLMPCSKLPDKSFAATFFHPIFITASGPAGRG